MAKFKIGDKVKIRKNSEFYWQWGDKKWGKIIDFDGDWFRVWFDDKTKNSYRASDLEFIERDKIIKKYGIVKFCENIYKKERANVDIKV